MNTNDVPGHLVRNWMILHWILRRIILRRACCFIPPKKETPTVLVVSGERPAPLFSRVLRWTNFFAV